eukprot:scaffold122303_cov48-Phaeocystis_antarctica.AAC.1
MCVTSPRTSSRALPCMPLAPPPRPPPSRLPVHTSPRFMCRPCDSAARGGVQQAAELRHVQRHKHGRHVRGACPRPRTSSRALPCMRLAPAHRAHRPLASRPTPRPASCAVLVTRQDTREFNQPLSLDTSSVTSMED